jgi:hypothetical protein|nr:MAG TPA: head closure knob [Caudoviricetes sp.]
MNGQDIVQRQYKDRCSVIEFVPVTDLETNITKEKEVIVLEDQKCKLCFKTVRSVGEGDTAKLLQTVSLHIAPDITIKEGSKVVVSLQTGQTFEYSRSGIPAIYPSHQEVPLEAFRGWA